MANNPDAHIFMEVPFKSGGKYYHYDALIFNKNLMIIVETKRLYNVERARSLKKDIDRIQCTSNIKKITDRFIKTPPKNIYGLVLAETWKENHKWIKDWWVDENESGYAKKWRKVCANKNGWTTEAVEIKCKIKEGNKKISDGEFYVLSGYRELK